MLLDEYRDYSWRLIKRWLVIFGAQLILFIVSICVTAIVLQPSSGGWFWEYLTFIKGVKNILGINPKTVATIAFFINIAITSFDFYSGYTMQKRSSHLLRNTYSTRETIILNKMHRHLKVILVLVLVTLFMQIVHGVVWWIIGSIVIMFKFWYWRELRYLRVCRTVKTESGLVYDKSSFI